MTHPLNQMQLCHGKYNFNQIARIFLDPENIVPMATVNNENQVKFIHMSKFYVNVDLILLETSFLGINFTKFYFF